MENDHEKLGVADCHALLSNSIDTLTIVVIPMVVAVEGGVAMLEH